jgi:hypothetical protein
MARTAPLPRRIDARETLASLVGQTIRTLTGRLNHVLRLDGANVIVGTTKSPAGKPVPIQEIQDALDRLVRDGLLEISVPSVGYRSAFIGAVLGTLPGAEATTRPGVIRLGGPQT